MYAHTHARPSLHCMMQRDGRRQHFSQEMVPFDIQLTNNGCLFSLPNGKKKKKKKLTAPGIPRRSPIQVLTRLDPI